MKEHWDFLKESDTSRGLFYPLHYTVAGFENIARANAAHATFVSGGFDATDVASVSGQFVINQRESQEGDAWYKKMQVGFAEVIGTETRFLDDNIALARRGGAFVFVHTPNQDLVERARGLIAQMQPIFARRCHRAGIEKILYPPEPSTL